MLKRIAILFAAVLLAAPAWGQTHLVPEDSAIASGHLTGEEEVASLLPELYAGDVVARMVVEPSFQPLYAVGVKQSGEKYEVLTLGEKLPAGKFGRTHGPLKLREADLDAGLAKRIIAVWKQVLLQTRYPEEVVCSDGTSYHFSVTEFGYMAGQVCSISEESSKPGLLAVIGETMFDYCGWRSAKLARQLDQEVTALENRLASEEKK